MKNRYDGTPGKDSALANLRQRRFEAENSAKNQFVKKVQAEQSRNGGRMPNLKGEAMEFDAYMCNNGAHAQELGKKLTAGLDKVAFPVDGEGNDS
jgi:hypothetical protein